MRRGGLETEFRQDGAAQREGLSVVIHQAALRHPERAGGSWCMLLRPAFAGKAGAV